MMRFTRKMFTGRRKYVAVPLLLVLVPTAAWAAFSLLFGITGQVQTASVTPVISTVSVNDSKDATCSITKTGDRTMSVSVTKAFPGAECSFHVVTTRPSGAQDALMVTQGIDFVASAHVTTKFASGSCGRIVNDPNLSATTNYFDFIVKVSPDVSMGTTYPASAGVGISLATQANYVAANCPTW